MLKFFLMLLYLHYSLFQICFCFFIGLRLWFSKSKSFVAMPPCVIKKTSCPQSLCHFCRKEPHIEHGRHSFVAVPALNYKRNSPFCAHALFLSFSHNPLCYFCLKIIKMFSDFPVRFFYIHSVKAVVAAYASPWAQFSVFMVCAFAVITFGIKNFIFCYFHFSPRPTRVGSVLF